MLAAGELGVAWLGHRLLRAARPSDCADRAFDAQLMERVSYVNFGRIATRARRGTRPSPRLDERVRADLHLGRAPRRFFLNLASTTQQLGTQQRFCNTLISNCTNELAKAANQAQPGAIPPNIALLLPGYADELLYDLGFIPTDAPLESVRQRFAITDKVAATIHQPEFSRLLRATLMDAND